MHTITINIKNDKLLEKIKWLLKHLKNDGLEIVSIEDMEDLKLLKVSRNEDSISFDGYLKNENENISPNWKKPGIKLTAKGNGLSTAILEEREK